MWEGVGDRIKLQHIDPTLSRSPGLLNLGPGGPASLGAGSLYRILSPTDLTSCAPSYIIVRHPPSSCGRHKSHSFNPSTVKVIFWYSSTGCTCYLHWCISYFDSLAGSEVNIQHQFAVGFAPWAVWRSCRTEYKWSMADSRLKGLRLRLGYLWGGRRDALITLYSTGLLGPVYAIIGHPCRLMLYIEWVYIHLGSSGSHCTKRARDQHWRAGLEPRLVPDFPLP